MYDFNCYYLPTLSYGVKAVCVLLSIDENVTELSDFILFISSLGIFTLNIPLDNNRSHPDLK